MEEIELTSHARNMLRERNIQEEWIRETLNSPGRKEEDEQGNTHYFKVFPEYDGRVLHVIVNEMVNPTRVITVFFDRRARRLR